jgi:hypothetical protein
MLQTQNPRRQSVARATGSLMTPISGKTTICLYHHYSKPGYFSISSHVGKAL